MVINFCFNCKDKNLNDINLIIFFIYLKFKDDMRMAINMNFLLSSTFLYYSTRMTITLVHVNMTITMIYFIN